MNINIVKKYNSACIFYNFKFQYYIVYIISYSMEKYYLIFKLYLF